MATTADMYLGLAAGVATSLFWTVGALVFTAAGRRLAPVFVNSTRILLAIILLGVTHRLWFGTWVPEALPGQVWFLAASGIIGLSIGDQALFVAFVDIGPRLSMLIMTTSPLFATLFGRLALGETLAGVAWLGMLMTIGGVAWVVFERPELPLGSTEVRRPHRAIGPHRARGVSLAFFAAACQAGGLLLSKQGMGHGWLPESQRLDPQAATLIRMVFAGFGMIPILWLHGRRERKRRATGLVPARIGRPRTGLLLAACGAVLGSYMGVWMSLVASDRTDLGIAQTLCSLSPVFILPFAATIYKEHISLRAVVGAVIAVAGSALLFVPTAS